MIGVLLATFTACTWGSISVLDFGTFVTRIEPILARPGPDGKACVNCHAVAGTEQSEQRTAPHCVCTMAPVVIVPFCTKP